MLNRCAVCCLLSLSLVSGSSWAAEPDLDPNALELLKATIDSIAGAKAFSFKAHVARDRQASNNQLVTYFNEDTVTVMRPDKLRIDVDGEHHDLQLFFDGSKATLFNPEEKLHLSQPAQGTIDTLIEKLEARNVSFPMTDLLQSHAYDSLIKGLQTAYVVGRVNVEGKTAVHLVFTEASADWQLWVEPGDKPVPVGMIIVYKSETGAPRVTMRFTDWNLNAQPDAGMFTFVKPDGAHEIQFLPVKAGK